MFKLYSNVRIYIRDFFTSTPILFKPSLNPKISFFIGKGGGVCAERDVTQGGSREKM